MPFCKKHSFIISLLFIILLGAFIRFYRLESVPPHLSNDEISIAYDSYSVSYTLRDEHLHFLPLSFQSHNTYKAPLYAYLAMLPIRILGNTNFSIRFLAALLGTLSIPLLIAIAYRLSRNRRLSLLSGLVLCISPWHINITRAASESNVGLFFLLAGIFAFLVRYPKTRIWSLIPASLFFSLSMYGYHTEWGLAPLLLVFLTVLYRKYLRSKKTLVIFIISFGLFSFPLFLDYLHNLSTNARGNTEVIWNAPYIKDPFVQGRFSLVKGLSNLSQTVLNNYIGSLNPARLFFNGIQFFRGSEPYNQGLFYPVLLPFFISGILVFRRYFPRHWKTLLFWLLVTPVVAALTQGDITIHRDFVSVAPISIFMAVGLYHFLQSPFFPSLLKVLVPVILTVSLIFFLTFYFIHFPVHSGINHQYGYQQIAAYVGAHYSEYNRIVIDPRFGPENRYDGVPHLYIPYFTRMDPAKMLLRRDTKSGLFFDKYQIGDVNWYIADYTPRTLFSVPESNLPPANLPNIPIRHLQTIYLPDGTPAFELYQTI